MCMCFVAYLCVVYVVFCGLCGIYVVCLCVVSMDDVSVWNMHVWVVSVCSMHVVYFCVVSVCLHGFLCVLCGVLYMCVSAYARWFTPKM